MKPRKVAILTAGGLAPCLNSAIGMLIERYTEIDPTIEIICYKSGYKGLLLGDAYVVTPEVRADASILTRFGGARSATAG
jgi:diphosphate-dependent phosphofructokinase